MVMFVLLNRRFAGAERGSHAKRASGAAVHTAKSLLLCFRSWASAGFLPVWKSRRWRGAPEI